MTTGQLHLNDVLAGRTMRPEPGWGRRSRHDLAAMTSLLVGVGVRRWLTDTEKEFLDSLAPEHCITFLIANKRYVHPEGVELFSSDELESASLFGGDALISLRQRHSPFSDNHCQLHTADIGFLGGACLTFGIAGPDNVDTFETLGDRFAEIAYNFRQACAEANGIVDALLPRLHEGTAVFLLNRASGRVMAINDVAAEVIGTEAREVVGREYGDVKPLLTRALSRGKLTMENLHFGSLELTAVSIARQARKSPTVPILLPRFLEAMQKVTFGLHTAAHHLQSIVRHEPGHPESELVHIVHEEATDLEDALQRFRMLAEYAVMEKTPTDPVTELREVMHRMAVKENGCHFSLRSQWQEPVTVRVAARSLTYLYDAILRSHGSHLSGSTTELVLQPGLPGPKMLFATRQNHIESAMANATWAEYASCLAAEMDLGFEQRTDGNVITTTLSL